MPAAFRVQQAGADKVIDRPAGSELGIEAQPRLWPQQPGAECLLDRLADALVADVQEPLDEPLVVADDRIPELEDIHESPGRGS